MNNIIYHTLKGITAKFSKSTINNIDVNKVTDMSYYKRYFMIFDRKYPYVLYIKYVESNNDLKLTTNNNVKWITKSDVKWITKRYQSIDDVENEISDIMKKQRKIE